MILRESLLTSRQQTHAARCFDPVEILGHQAAQWAQEAATTAAAAISDNAPMSRHAIKMATLLLSLVNDIVHEVQIQKLDIIGQQDYDDHNKLIIDVMSTDNWCHAAMQAATLSPSSDFKRLVFSPLQKMALKAVSTLGRHCLHYYHHDDDDKNNKKDGQHLVVELKRLHDEQVEKMMMETKDANSNANLRSTTHTNDKERLQLLVDAMASITTTTDATTQ